MFKFLNSTPARVITIFLLVQTAVLYSSARRDEYVPSSRPLADVPHQLGSWHMAGEGYVDKETQEILKADDTLSRVYKNPAGVDASLWVAAFRTQRNGKAPHSPKNCMPGAGWTQVSSDNYSLDVGLNAPIVVNKYEIAHSEERELVLYWYQSRDRVVADEFKAKFWVVADAMRFNRTDTALVRVIVGVNNNDVDAATAVATNFVQSFFGTLRQYLPA